MRLVALCCIPLVLACAAGAAWTSTAPKSTLKPFASEREFDDLLERWRVQARTAMEQRRADAVVGALALNAAPAAPAAKAMADSAVAEKKEADSISNVQTAGVDEGGIVKRAGDHLVILRRGRLFTVRVGGDALKPVAMVNAYAPDASPAGAWYDELLIHGHTVVVIGYSYARGGTEIGLFELGRDGSLAYRATHHLRSHDYYSSRNYASRLVGSKLVFYSPMHVHPSAPNPDAFLPQWRRWNAATPDNWQRILPATRIYRTDDEIDPLAGGAALHTVTACDLAEPEAMRCEASAVLAPPGRVFYVSAANVYVWTTEWQRRSPWGRGESTSRSAVFRLPLDGAAPSALKTTGAPIDQLSFLEDERGHLNVLLRAQGRGEGMWNAERGAGELALLRVPLADFGDGRSAAPRNAYRPLPGAAGHLMHNRFVGDWLLYGQHGLHAAHALRYAERDAEAQPLAISHGVERIEALGRDAVLVGNAGRDLHFTSLRLAADARVADRFVQRDAAQGETRTHGFFYRSTARDEGVLGLPIVGRARAGMAAHRGESAAVLFLRNRSLGLHPVGELQASPQRSADDACKASCVDWYGNARPIFLGDRVIALLGYELVEGRVSRSWGSERIDELRRVNFGPQPASAWGRD
jgi:Beta propeller domain